MIVIISKFIYYLTLNNITKERISELKKKKLRKLIRDKFNICN